MGRIIGLTGFEGRVAGVGKDTAANYLLTYHRAQFRSIAFADPIRAAMRAIFGWDDSYFAHPKKNEIDPAFGISPRKAMQTMGTEWGRNLVNSDLWLILAGQKAFPQVENGFDVLITDCRFENEAKWIRANGGVVWHIDRKAELIESAVGNEVKHTSETGVKFVKGDVKIDNNETLGFMFEALDGLAAGLAERSQRIADEEAETLEAVARLKPYMVVPGDAEKAAQ